MEILPGTEVLARGLRWEVVFSQPAGEQQLYRLRSVESAWQGRELDVLVPFEKVEPVARDFEPTKAALLQQWRVFHQAFLLEQALGTDALLAAQPGRLTIAAYQLVPVMRALRMSRPRLLLADDVGLGKTIEAGLILAELIARRRAHRILIVSPAGPLMSQWQQEMRERFGLRFAVLDSQSVQQLRFSNEAGANPFDHEAFGLISIDYAKQEKVLQDLERTQYDVVVVDEAHHCVSLGKAGDREDSQRRKLAEVLARRSDALLLLTATPHDGFDPHFASLVELLDPSLVDGRGALRGEKYQEHVVRRLKRHIKDPATGQPMFRERKVHPIQVSCGRRSESNYAQFQESFLSLVAPQLRRALKRGEYAEVLAFISLLKRSVSTASACASTLRVVADHLEERIEKGQEAQEARKQRIRTLRDLQRRKDRFGYLSPEEEQDQAQLEAEDVAGHLLEEGAEELERKLGLFEREARREREQLKSRGTTRDALRVLARLAEEASAEDPKLEELVAQIQSVRAQEPAANILVYTEYTDSQRAVIARLERERKAGKLTGRVLELSGATPDSKGEASDPDATPAGRQEVTGLFTSVDDLVLVSTDASAEGLNLHERCHHLIHVELPYNPNRLEQRNGRIDRFGQKHDPQVRYLYLAGTFEERLLIRLVARYEAQLKRLKFVPNTLGISVANASMRLLEGLADEDRELFKAGKPVTLAALPADDTTTPAYQDMLSEIDRVFTSFEKAAKTHAWLGEAGLGASEAHVQEADRARERAEELGAVDLLGFVVDALRTESPEADAVREQDGVWELKLPRAWSVGMEDVPGLEPEKQLLRVTTDVEALRDADGHRLGYLGRAHPTVRRAIDRVRNVQFSRDGQLLDRRVSAAKTDAKEPALLFTFLGRVQSGAGRELERVLAVRISKSGKLDTVPSHRDWSELAAAERALSTKGVWAKHFGDWAKPDDERARRAAEECFAAFAADFAMSHQGVLDEEKRSLDVWLRARAHELCGPRVAQAELFEEGNSGLTAPKWKILADDAGRLAAFASDAAVAPHSRSEARTVLEIQARRAADLARRAALEPPKVVPLGILMLVPEQER